MLTKLNSQQTHNGVLLRVACSFWSDTRHLPSELGLIFRFPIPEFVGRSVILDIRETRCWKVKWKGKLQTKGHLFHFRSDVGCSGGKKYITSMNLKNSVLSFLTPCFLVVGTWVLKCAISHPIRRQSSCPPLREPTIINMNHTTFAS